MNYLKCHLYDAGARGPADLTLLLAELQPPRPH